MVGPKDCMKQSLMSIGLFYNDPIITWTQLVFVVQQTGNFNYYDNRVDVLTARTETKQG